MAISSIGPYNVVSMSQFPSAPMERLVTESRAGVDGNAIWKVGFGGSPFTVKTVVDANTFAQAQNIMRSYESLVGQGPLGIIYGGVAAPFLVVVLSVTPIEVSEIALGVGGLLGTSLGIVQANWQLLPWQV